MKKSSKSGKFTRPPSTYEQLVSKTVSIEEILNPLGIDTKKGLALVLRSLGNILSQYGDFKDEGSRYKLSKDQVVIINSTAYLLKNFDESSVLGKRKTSCRSQSEQPKNRKTNHE